MWSGGRESWSSAISACAGGSRFFCWRITVLPLPESLPWVTPSHRSPPESMVVLPSLSMGPHSGRPALSGRAWRGRQDCGRCLLRGTLTVDTGLGASGSTPPGLEAGLQPCKGSPAAGRATPETAHSHHCSCRVHLPAGLLEWPCDTWTSDGRSDVCYS